MYNKYVEREDKMKSVVPHYNYHPKSWSEQARELSTRIYNNVASGSWTLEQSIHFFSISYRHPLIVNRAAKRFGRLIRK